MIHAVFLRGINISGKNKIPMKELKAILSKNDYPDAETLLNSGNIVLSSHKMETELSHHIATLIKENFGLAYLYALFPPKNCKGLCAPPPDGGTPATRKFTTI